MKILRLLSAAALLIASAGGCDKKEETLIQYGSPSGPPPALSALEVSRGSLSPAFARDVTTYSVPLVFGAAMSVTPTAADPGTTIKVNGTPVVSGTESQPLALALGLNVVELTLLASDGISERSYLLLVLRAEEEAYVKASNPDFGDQFGQRVSVDGDVLVVGTPLESSSTTGVNSTPDNAATYSGAVYVFRRTNGVWAQEAYLKASNTGDYDYFGDSVAVSGDVVVVGATYEDSSTTGVNSTPNEAGNDSGAAYIFRRTAGVWAQEAYLKASNAGVGDRFGSSIAVSGDGVVVGAHYEDSSTTGVNSTPDEGAVNSGAAYVFRRTAGIWAQEAYLKASNTGGNDQFGLSVAVSGDAVVVGAHYEDSSTTGVNSIPDEGAADSGAAYVFRRTAGIWTQEAFLKASNTSGDDRFGSSVAVSGDVVVAGAWVEDSSTTGVNSTPNEAATDSGAAYVFRRTAGVWAQEAYLKASNTGGNDAFGISVAVSGDVVVVGASGEDSSTTGVNSTPDEATSGGGAAYVFRRTAGVWAQEAYLKASNTGLADGFGYSTAVSGDVVVVGALFEDSSTTGVNSIPDEGEMNSGAVYIFR